MIINKPPSLFLRIIHFLIALPLSILFADGVSYILFTHYEEVKTPGYELVIIQREEEGFPSMYHGSTTHQESGNKKITIFFPDTENKTINPDTENKTINPDTENKTIKIEREVNGNVEQINCDSEMCEIKNGENYSYCKILGWSLQKTEKIENIKEPPKTLGDIIRETYNEIKKMFGY